MNGLNLVEVSQCSLSYWLFSLFSRHISRTQSFQQNRHIIFPALVALKLLVSLISRLVARGARIVVDTHTHTQTHRTTTVTLAAHARRGLIMASVSLIPIPQKALQNITELYWGASRQLLASTGQSPTNKSAAELQVLPMFTCMHSNS